MEKMEKKSGEGKSCRITGTVEKNNIFLSVDSFININGLTDVQLSTISSSLAPAAHGYKAVKALSFSQQKETFYNLQPEFKTLSNSQLRTEIDKQLEYGRVCEEILASIEGWRREQNDKEDSKN